MVFEHIIRHRPVKPAQAGLAPVVRSFSRRADCERALWIVTPCEPALDHLV